MKRELAIEFSRVTEAAALAGYKWLGRGDKNTADGAAVHAMRIVLNQVNIDGTIVIGEGEIDEAPMLYIGEKVGTGKGDAVDIAVDPIEGTRMTAMGQANALAVLAVGDKGCFLNAPDMYMEKLIVGPGAKGAIDLSLPLEENLRNIARAGQTAERADRDDSGETAPRRHHRADAKARRARVCHSGRRRCRLHSDLHAGQRSRRAVRHRRRAGRRGLCGGDPRAGWRYAGASAAP
jgi:hypothetical protein